MRKIRKGVWETNSSSVHSLILNNFSEETFNTDMFPTYEKYGKKILKLELGEYGWGYDKLSSSLEKAEYLALCSIKGGWKEQFEEVMHSVLDFDEIDYVDWGNSYIDHQSEGNFDELSEDLNKLKSVIFLNKFAIEIDHDNH